MLSRWFMLFDLVHNPSPFLLHLYCQLRYDVRLTRDFRVIMLTHMEIIMDPLYHLFDRFKRSSKRS
jgi:hypothetical protein